MASIEIVDLAGTRLEGDWDAYVASRPDASCYHALVWREILSQSFGHRPHYLARAPAAPSSGCCHSSR